MESFSNLGFLDTLSWLFPLLIFLVLWEAVWKVIAMWKSARNNHLAWFIFIALINTVGILPIIYIIKYKKKKEEGK